MPLPRWEAILCLLVPPDLDRDKQQDYRQQGQRDREKNKAKQQTADEAPDDSAVAGEADEKASRKLVAAKTLFALVVVPPVYRRSLLAPRVGHHIGGTHRRIRHRAV